jgi:hypothetical protein
MPKPLIFYPTTLLAGLFGGFHDPVAGHALDLFSDLVHIYFLRFFFLIDLCGGWLTAGFGAGLLVVDGGLRVDDGWTGRGCCWTDWGGCGRALRWRRCVAGCRDASGAYPRGVEGIVVRRRNSNFGGGRFVDVGGIALADQAIGFGFQGGGGPFLSAARAAAAASAAASAFSSSASSGSSSGSGKSSSHHWSPPMQVWSIGAVVDDYIHDVRGPEGGVAKVETGGLQGVEEQAGDFGVDLAGGEQAHDVHEGDLDGIGVFEDGKIEAGAAVAGAVAAELDALLLKAFVEETETVAFECGRAALGSVDFEMLTTRDAEE